MLTYSPSIVAASITIGELAVCWWLFAAIAE
jgi:hypothetical protein